MSSELPINIREQIEKGISILNQGGLVAYPTDTVYGLGASAKLPQAVERIYQVKGRPRHMALPLLLADISQIGKVAKLVPPVAWLFARHFLPGALTLVLLKSSSVHNIITANSEKVAVRVPAHPVPVALVRGLMSPIVGTSANLSGRPSTMTAEEVWEQFGGEIDLVINGGRSRSGRESTIVDVTGERPLIIREGAISSKELQIVYSDIAC